MALLSVILEARIELIYLQTSLRGFHLLLHSKTSQHQSPSADNYCIYTTQYSLFDYCWMISLRVIIFIVRRSKSLKKYGTDLIGSLELNKLSLSELSLSVSLSVTFQKIIDISENYRYRLCFCVLTLILLKKNYFFEHCDVIEFS